MQAQVCVRTRIPYPARESLRVAAQSLDATFSRRYCRLVVNWLAGADAEIIQHLAAIEYCYGIQLVEAKDLRLRDQGLKYKNPGTRPSPFPSRALITYFLRRKLTKPANPSPSNAKLPGSGTDPSGDVARIIKVPAPRSTMLYGFW